MEWLTGFFEISLDRANEFYTWGWSLSACGAVVTVIGVGLLWWGTRIRDHEFEVSMANLHDRASTSDKRSKVLERGNLTLQRDVERERMERLKLEAKLAPRSLTDEQIGWIRGKVAPFAGQKFGMITYWGTPEPDSLTKRIGENALIPAGWEFLKAERFEALIGIVAGIAVQISEDSTPEAKAAAEALVGALNDEGVKAIIKFEPAYKDLIKIQVGIKP
jgi:hypothetical protein